MKNENSQETVDLVGVKDGVETPLGKIPMPPEMKLKEIMRTYFGGDANDPESDACLGVAAGMEFFNWLTRQGYKHRSSLDGNEAVEALKDAMNSAEVPVEFRVPLIGYFCNHWNARETARRTAVDEASAANPSISKKDWDDAYAAFVGAFDNPLARRQVDNDFAQDARRRLHAINEQMTATSVLAAPEGSRSAAAIAAFRSLLEQSTPEEKEAARQVFCELLDLEPKRNPEAVHITDERIIEIRQKTPAQPGLWGQTIPFARALLAERDSTKG